MTSPLPRYVALERGGKYLRYVQENGELHSRIQLSSKEVLGEQAFTKLEVESAESSSEKLMLVHLRSCYNNKYLVLSSQDDDWVVAAANMPEEDRSKRSCTLFRLGLQPGNKVWLYLQSNGAEHGVKVQAPEQCLSIGRNTPASAVTFQYTDLDSLAILPKHVMFKGDNNKYLSARKIKGKNMLEFSRSNPMVREVEHQSYMLPDGDVRLWSDKYKKYWRRTGSGWIYSDNSDKSSNNKDTVFRPVRLDSNSNAIALLSRGNNKYCRRHTSGTPIKNKQTLIANTSSVTPKSVLLVEEAIREREIYDVLYRLDDARIYDAAPVNNVIQTASNWSSTLTADKQLGFTYTKMSQETFTSSHSWKIKVSIQMKTGIPSLVQGVVRVDASYQGSMEWSKMKEVTEEVNSFVDVQVPPLTKVVVTMMIGRGSIDVPFSYTQRDILPDGRIIIQRLHDGLFSGVNTELIDYNIEEESLSPVDMSSKL